MTKQLIYIGLLFFSLISFSQVTKIDSLSNENSDLNDSLISKIIMIEEVVISRQKLDPETKRQYLILQNRVYKVYPFAKTAAERLTMLDNNLEKFKNPKDKRKYFKIVEEYVNTEFKEKLKKLSRKQGQILIKLLFRQTGKTTYSLIKDYKSGWSAFWSNSTASLFDLNLKEKFDPLEVNEDYFIETILNRAFSNGRLVEQKAVNPIDIDQLNTAWENKIKELKVKK